MLTPEQIAALRDKVGHLTDPVNDFLLEDIARRISEAGQLTSTAAYQVWRSQQLGVSQRELKKRLRKLLKVSHRELRKLLAQAAEVGYDFDIKHFPQVQAVRFRENGTLQQILAAAVELAEEDFTNLTQTLGMMDPHGNALPLQDAYRSCTDFAFKQVITGAADYNTAIRRATKNLAEKGILTIDYESGIHTSLEAAVRRNIMGGLGLMVERITQYDHDLLGADGWEISAHANSAPDHEPYQGKQYSDEAYAALNGSLIRRIGTLNCGHNAMPIILGVNAPQYTPEELERFREDNAKGITYEGKHYTGYEATQMQRRIERSMRKQKRNILLADGTNDKEKLLNSQIKLQRLRQEYKHFSSAAGLRTEVERAQVAGFGHKQAARASAAADKHHTDWLKSIGAKDAELNSLAKYYDAKYNNAPNYQLLRIYARDVESGWISPNADFNNYLAQYQRIQREIVGSQTKDGISITGQREHFMQRLLGTSVDPEKYKKDHRIIRRSGVSVDDIKSALFEPEIIDPPVVRADGKRSVRYIGKDCVVTVNPDTGELIQTNPRKKGKKNA